MAPDTNLEVMQLERDWSCDLFACRQCKIQAMLEPVEFTNILLSNPHCKFGLVRVFFTVDELLKLNYV